jgi:hypothetical protein
LSKTEKQKMLAGELYRPDDELGAEQAAAKAWMVRYNAALASPVSERHALLCERLGRVGKGAVIRPPFHCDFGYNIVSVTAFLFNCVTDVVEVTSATHQIGPAADLHRRPSARCWRAPGLIRRPVPSRRRRIGSAILCRRHDRRRHSHRRRRRGDAGRGPGDRYGNPAALEAVWTSACPLSAAMTHVCAAHHQH